MTFASHLKSGIWRLVAVVGVLFAAMLLAVYVRLAVLVLVGLGIFGFSLVLGHCSGEKRARWGVGFGGIISVPLWWLIGWGDHVCDYYYGVIMGLVAVALALLDQRGVGKRAVVSWRGLSLAWGMAGLLVCGWMGYWENHRLAFFAAGAGGVSLLVLAKRTLRLPALLVQCVNTALLLVPGLWLADLLLFPLEHTHRVPAPEARPYSFAAFQRDPAGFERWLDFLSRESTTMYRQMFVMGSNGVRLAMLQSNVTVRLGAREIPINNLGFRGANIPPEKGRAYRIVALGESTTFGITVEAQSRPWCEWLQEIIQNQLRPDRPVEVINAGIPSVSLHENLERLSGQILPLQPDLIISYHGYNQFGAIDAALPPVRTQLPPPRFRARPLELLARAEYRWRMRQYTQRVAPTIVAPDPAPVDLMQTEYAADYRTLIQFCREHDVSLALATYSMAVNEQSPRAVWEFHHRLVHSLKRQIRANAAHAQIVRELVRQNPEVRLVETQPALDGKYDYFMDLVHFTPEGEQQMAEAVFAGIKETLLRELAKPQEGATNR